MAECAYCKAETELHVNNVPVCLTCSEDREAKRKPPQSENQIHRILVQELLEATHLRNEANQEFEAIMGQFPSGFPHPDGTQRIYNASAKLSIARKNMMAAHRRLDDF